MNKAGDLLLEDHHAAGDADPSNQTPAFSRMDQQVPISIEVAIRSSSSGLASSIVSIHHVAGQS